MVKKTIRHIILEAAERVMHAKGLTETRMEDVSREAELGVDGIFRYFPNKKELVLGLIEQYERVLYTLRDEIIPLLPEQPSRMLKATLLALIDHPSKVHQSTANTIALLADPDIRREVGRIKRDLFDDIVRNTPDTKMAVLALLIYDGIWVAEMFSEYSYPSELVSEIAGELLASLDTPLAQTGCSA